MAIYKSFHSAWCVFHSQQLVASTHASLVTSNKHLHISTRFYPFCCCFAFWPV